MEWNPNLYDTKHSFVSKYGEGLIDLLHPQPGESILDLGCGTGDLTNIIQQRGADVIGIDSSSEMIAAAKQKYPSLIFFQMDARDFSFNKTFHSIFSNAVLHWIPEAERVIVNVYTHLKLQGNFVAEFGGKDNIAGMLTALVETLKEFGYNDNASQKTWYYPSVGEYALLLEKNRFTVQFAQHFKRETQLDGDDGMKNWFRMFRGNFFQNIPSDKVEEILTTIESKLRSTHFRNGHWYADYKRIRIIAMKR
jgi:trans-aconitate methyltransferase